MTKDQANKILIQMLQQSDVEFYSHSDDKLAKDCFSFYDMARLYGATRYYEEFNKNNKIRINGRINDELIEFELINVTYKNVDRFDLSIRCSDIKNKVTKGFITLIDFEEAINFIKYKLHINFDNIIIEDDPFEYIQSVFGKAIQIYSTYVINSDKAVIIINKDKTQFNLFSRNQAFDLTIDNIDKVNKSLTKEDHLVVVSIETFMS